MNSIHTNTPYNVPTIDPTALALQKLEKNSYDNPLLHSDPSALDLTSPSPVKSRPTQSYLPTASTSTSTSTSAATSTEQPKKKPKLPAGAPRATLVVAPMTLLSQWCDELERSAVSSKGGKKGMKVLLYYGNKRESGGAGGLEREIESGGWEVVVTSCVTFPILSLLHSLSPADNSSVPTYPTFLSLPSLLSAAPPAFPTDSPPSSQTAND